MRTMRYSSSRQKACQQCVSAKSKCDRTAQGGGCTRCRDRGLPCIYPQTQQPSPGSNDDTTIDLEGVDKGASSPRQTMLPDQTNPLQERSLPPNRQQAGRASTNTTSFTSSGDPEHLDFHNMELICPIRVEEIANRWLGNFIPVPDQVVKSYPPATSALIYRILKSYVDAPARGRGVPPFIHPLQLSLPQCLPLSTCLSVIRICGEPLRGSHEIVAEVLQREMTRVYEQHSNYDHLDLLAAFQAYLIYAMAIFFRLGQTTNSSLRQAMISLQELAGTACRQGLTSMAEQGGTRPKWEAWIVAEAKRRTLFTMYLFDSVLLTQDNLPTYLGSELEGLSAPSGRSLWEAQTRRDWTTAYNMHMTDWIYGSLRIDELWPIPDDLEEDGMANRRARVDRWLEDLDSYGTFMYAVTSCTHGG